MWSRSALLTPQCNWSVGCPCPPQNRREARAGRRPGRLARMPRQPRCFCRKSKFSDRPIHKPAPRAGASDAHYGDLSRSVPAFTHFDGHRPDGHLARLAGSRFPHLCSSLRFAPEISVHAKWKNNEVDDQGDEDGHDVPPVPLLPQWFHLVKFGWQASCAAHARIMLAGEVVIDQAAMPSQTCRRPIIKW